jgi:hypothetical protein
MTTPDAPAPGPPDPAATDAGRVRRTRPARAGPNRTFGPSAAPSAAADAAPGPSATGRNDPPPASDAPVSEAIAQAVQLGYRVIGKNIDQGRAAAEQFRAGQYNVRDVPHDLNQMTLRLLSLTRELSVTACDILERVLRDPGFPGAVQRAASPPRDGTDGSTGRRDFTPPPFYTAGTAPSGPTRPATEPATPPPTTTTSSPAAVELSCKFVGKRPAVVRAASLARPDAPTPLALNALAALDSSVPPIGPVTFSADGSGGVVANITITDEQPAGLYSGVICAADTQIALGVLTIEIPG